MWDPVGLPVCSCACDLVPTVRKDAPDMGAGRAESGEAGPAVQVQVTVKSPL